MTVDDTPSSRQAPRTPETGNLLPKTLEEVLLAMVWGYSPSQEVETSIAYFLFAIQQPFYRAKRRIHPFFNRQHIPTPSIEGPALGEGLCQAEIPRLTSYARTDIILTNGERATKEYTPMIGLSPLVWRMIQTITSTTL